MQIIPQILFACALAIAGYFLFKSIVRLRRNTTLGQRFVHNLSPLRSIKNMTLFALGQKKMFARPIPAILHFVIYAGFLIINVEVLEIVLDGLLGTHRLFARPLGNFYSFFINVFEFFAAGVFISCVIFLIRRNVVKVKRFQLPDLTAWPRLDGNLILIIEILLMAAFLKMNAADQVLQSRLPEHYVSTDRFLISGLLTPPLENFSTQALLVTERGCWWFHILGILAFANYIPYSKHLHILLAFPNTYYSAEEPKGKIHNMPLIMNEVASMFNFTVPQTATGDTAAPARFGAKDVTDLSNKSLLEAYTCTECGRCTSECPANITGKKLSPRKIMMDTRDRADELGAYKQKHGKESTDEKSLFDYISDEELLACTSCNACVEACPVNINPLNIILEMRRYRVLEESKAPGEWAMVFNNLDTGFSPWKFATQDRDKWKEKI